ncbi:hypothetical protein [Halocola ammonii]
MIVRKIILYSGLAGITVFIGVLFSHLFNHHVKDSPLKLDSLGRK